jgi:hypothetical protein
LFGKRREVTFMTEVLEDLVYRPIPAETDNLARAELFSAVETGLGKNPSVDIPLDDLIAKISDDNPAWTANVLLLMARWGHRKHLPLVRGYLTHPNEHIRANAESAWKTPLQKLRGRSPERRALNQQAHKTRVRSLSWVGLDGAGED